MKTWIPKSNILRTAIVFFVFCFLVYVFSISALFRKKTEIRSHNNQTFSALAKEEESVRLRSIIDANHEVIDTVRNYFISKQDDITFIENIERVGREARVNSEISAITERKSNDESKDEILVKVNFEGSWNSVFGFLDKIEKMPYGIVVQSFNVESSAQGGWEGFVEFIMYKEK